MLEEAEREIQDLQTMMLEERTRAAATPWRLPHPPPLPVPLLPLRPQSPATPGVGNEMKEAERVADEATETAECAARRVAMLQEECDAGQT